MTSFQSAVGVRLTADGSRLADRQKRRRSAAEREFVIGAGDFRLWTLDFGLQIRDGLLVHEPAERALDMPLSQPVIDAPDDSPALYELQESSVSGLEPDQPRLTAYG
jgi:hypothetical protein